MDREDLTKRLADLYRSHAQLVAVAATSKKQRLEMLKRQALGESADAKEMARLRSLALDAEERAEASLSAAEEVVKELKLHIDGERDRLAGDLKELGARLRVLREKAKDELGDVLVPLVRDLGCELKVRRDPEKPLLFTLHLNLPVWFASDDPWRFHAQVERKAKEGPNADDSLVSLAKQKDELFEKVKGYDPKTLVGADYMRFDVKKETLLAVKKAVELADLDSCPHSLAFLEEAGAAPSTASPFVATSEAAPTAPFVRESDAPFPKITGPDGKPMVTTTVVPK